MIARSTAWRAPHVVAMLATPPVLEPLTIEQGKLRAGLDWAAGDVRDALMLGFIQTAVGQVQRDTGVALLTQTYDVLVDALTRGRLIDLPFRPVQTVTVSSIDTAGDQHALDASEFILDPSSASPVPARVSIASEAWPTDLRPFQPWLFTIVVGYQTVNALQAAAPGLVHAVGLLTAHYATLGRDLATIDSTTEIPYGYKDAIAPYQLVVVA